MIKLFKIFKKPYFWLIMIIILAFLVRLYKIDTPIADWHSWRQADTAAVSRSFTHDFKPFYPKGVDLSGVAEKPIPNLGGYRFVEFPIYNIFVYPFYLIFGSIDLYSRLVSVLFSLGSIIFLYILVKNYFGQAVALTSSLIYALLPFNIFFSRTTLPEPTFVFFALGMVYFVRELITGRKKLLWSALIFTSVAFLIKPWAIFYFLPLWYVYYKKNGTWFLGKKDLLFILGVLIPFVLWRLWILQFPEGIPASNWLLNGDGIRFRPAFWWWIISERLGHEILGVTGLFLFLIGFLLRPKNGNYFLHLWVLSMFLYLIVFATGNVRHDYYQYIFIPVACIFLAKGFWGLISGVSDFVPRFWTIILTLLFLPLTFYFTWTQVKEFYKINNPPIIEAGKMADQILPKGGVVVAPYNGDTAFLYQINRQGFPVVAYPLPQLVSDYGVTHYVSVNRDDQTNWVLRHFEILVDDPKFIIADLTKPKGNLYDPKDKEP